MFEHESCRLPTDKPSFIRLLHRHPLRRAFGMEVLARTPVLAWNELVNLSALLIALVVVAVVCAAATRSIRPA